MTKSNRNIKQKTGDIKGDVTISNSDIKAGRDVTIHIGDKISLTEVKEQGFDVGINPLEIFIIRFGRYLAKILGYGRLVSLLVLIGLSPTAGYLGYGWVTADDFQLYLLDNILIFIIVIIVLFGSFAFIGIGNRYRCSHCGNLYATIPYKRKLMGKTEYKNGELYKYKELRICEICNRTSSHEYTKEYRESN